MSRDPNRRPRRARIFRWTVLVLSWSVLLLLTVRTAASIRAQRRLGAAIDTLEQRVGTLDPHIRARSVVPEPDNQAPLFRAASEALTLEKGEEALLAKLARSRGPDAIIHESRAVHAILDRNPLVLALTAAAATRSGSNWEIDDEACVYPRLPNLLKLVRLARLLSVSSRLAAAERRTTDAIAALDQGFALSRSLSEEPILLVQLVRLSFEDVMQGALREILSMGELPRDGLVHLQRTVDSSASPGRMGILGELRQVTRIGEHIASGRSIFDLSKEGPGGGITGSSFTARTMEWIARPYLLSVQRQLIEDLGALNADLERPRYRRPDLPEPPQTGGFPDLAGVLWDVQLPTLRHFVLRSDLWSARTALTCSALALRRYRVDRGVYPDRLEALVPEYLEQLPIDPFRGEPPSYRREGSGFVLASAGDDPRYDAGPQYPRDLTWHLPL